MARTLEQLDAIRALRDDIAATRTRALDHSRPLADRRVDQERLTALVAKVAELEAPGAPTAPPPILDPKATPENAAKRAAEIRADPRFWDRHRRDAAGNSLTAEEHARLCRELVECDERASTPAPDGGAA